MILIAESVVHSVAVQCLPAVDVLVRKLDELTQMKFDMEIPEIEGPFRDWLRMKCPASLPGGPGEGWPDDRLWELMRWIAATNKNCLRKLKPEEEIQGVRQHQFVIQ